MIGIIVTSHPAHFHFIQDSLAAIDAQVPDRGLFQKILALDNAPDDYVPPVSKGWKLVRGNWSNPGQARNAALAEIAPACSWVLFWDSDNLIPQGYLANGIARTRTADENVAVLYPQIIVQNVPRSDDVTGDPRRSCFTDTAGYWRVDALNHVGGWETRLSRLEDYELGGRLKRSGWELRPLNFQLELHEHGERRSHGQRFPDAVWNCRSLGVLIIFCGDVRLLDRWVPAVQALELPIHCGLTVVDNSFSKTFARKLRTALGKVEGRFERVTIIKGDTWPRWSQLDRFGLIHNLVSWAYTRGIEATPEDTILTWEDDVFPHEIETAAKKLAQRIIPGAANRIAASAGVYASRDNPGVAVATTVAGRWSQAPRLAGIPRKPIQVAGVAGGFTVWSRPALEACPIRGTKNVGNALEPYVLGWDGEVSRRLHAQGWGFILDGSVTCDHWTDRGKEKKQTTS
jgi:glycosyltransferase involved in cell wall biosynthesis